MIQHQEYVHLEDLKGISLCILEQHREPIQTTTFFRPVVELKCGQSCKLDQRCALPVRIFYYPLMPNVSKWLDTLKSCSTCCKIFSLFDYFGMLCIKGLN